MLFCDNYARAMEYIQRIDELPTLKNIILLKSEDKIPNGLIEGSKIGVSFNIPNSILFLFSYMIGII